MSDAIDIAPRHAQFGKRKEGPVDHGAAALCVGMEEGALAEVLSIQVFPRVFGGGRGREYGND